MKISKQKSFSNKEYFLLNSIRHLTHFEREENEIKREKKIIREEGIKRIKEEIISPTIKIYFSLRPYRPKIK